MIALLSQVALAGRRSASRFLSTLPAVTSDSKPLEGEPDKLYKIVELEMRGHDPTVLSSYAKFATTAGRHFNIECSSWPLFKPTHERLTVLKSVHIYKKHRVQYEMRTYYMFVQYKRLTGSTADTLLAYVQINLPEGVSLKTTKIELQRLPDYFRPPENSKS